MEAEGFAPSSNKCFECGTTGLVVHLSLAANTPSDRIDSSDSAKFYATNTDIELRESAK